MQLGEFELVNEEKVGRVIEGTTNAKGEKLAGLGQDALETNAMLVLAEYDKLGGLVRGKEGANIKTGSFYDFEKKQPRKKPELIYVFRLNGEIVEVPDGEPVPLEVKAAKIAEAKTKKKGAKKDE